MTTPPVLAAAPALLARITLQGADHARHQTFAPASGVPLASVPLGGAADVGLAMERARAAQASWHHVPIAERGRVFVRFHDLLLDRQADALDLIQLESGKARRHAWEEVIDVASLARYYAHHARRHLRPRRRRGAIPGLTRAWEVRHPKGVVGIIAPWNYPLSMAATDAIPALMAGNAVVLKPDLQTGLSALWVAALLDECGLPRDLFQVVTGGGPEVGEPLVDAADCVVFTGSTRTGRLVARRAADRLTSFSLELGGKNAMLVLDDADLDAAVDGAIRGCFASAGQLCMSFERLYVQAGIHDRFAARFIQRTRALVLNGALDFTADMGSLASQRQLEVVRGHVEEAVARGARVLAGGRHRPDIGPFFFEPTILADVREGMTCFADETFGPVVAVYRFTAVEEAVARANASRYGLNASIWTRNVPAALRIAEQLEAGTVNVNEAFAAAWGSVDAPMGGFKESGMGRRHGAEGILKYTEPQTVAAHRGLPIALPAGLDPVTASRGAAVLLKLMRRIPGLR